ncbi:CHASE domain-containing protein [Aquabacterium sp. CECT 9606]|uniref:CHASE domain-containing protein n=1 Tax=Aquabacterium sp. CECT 9606 TaxID=2845822 RepID=UPI001E5B86AD|nr:CHASE domain-containing protein [Aquabacterium sp. CECT 9606]CAH0348463.1 Sensor histidine kinase RcsC [Aquabacterium sp. CECT 9606]
MRQALAPTSPWTRGFITWLVYTAAGVLALGLASPQDHVEPLYLSAGFGLACVLGWGKAMVLPVGLGSATVLTIAHWQAQDPVGFWPFLTLAVVTCLGGALQAWVAARWSGPGADEGLPLEKPLDIGRFLLVAGPVACLVNAGMSVPAMVALGILPASQAPQTALSWWAGDTLGVLIGTPMMLTLVGRPVDLWRARRLIVGVPLLVTTLLLGLTIHQVQLWEEERAQAVFDHDVEAVTNAVNLRLNGYLSALEALHGLYIASSEVSRQEFKLASTHWLKTLSGIQAMGWTERLTLDQIPSFEGRQHAEGLPQYQVHDTRAHLVPKGPEVAAIRFLEPMAGNEKALGYNSLSSPAAKDAFEQSRREDRPVATKGLELAQESGQQTGVVVYRAIYQGQPYTPQARVRSTRGAVFLALRMDDMIKAMTHGLPSYLSACLMDASHASQAFLGGAPQCARGVKELRQAYQTVIPIEFAGRQWQLVTWAHAPVPVVAGLAWSWLLAIGGVVLAAALGALLLVITGHTRRVEAAMDVARRQKAAAEAANRSKSEFLSRMSHELRTPLNAVLGFAQVMDLDRQSPLAPSQSQRLQQIQQAGWHLLDMIDDVLDLSRIDTGMLKLNTEAVPINEAVVAAMEMVRELAQKQQVRLLDPEPAPAGWGVQADAIRLRQILINLLSNAIKYNRPEGSVKVSMGMASLPDQPECISVTVEDTGLGLSPEQLSQLFQPFNRLGRERVAPDGAGIGLVISQHLAQLMGGQLDVVSQENKGSSFTLTLPAVKLLMPKPMAPPAPAPTSVITKVNQPVRHVLYVEDNHVNSEVVRGALASRGWIKLTVAPTIEEGLAVLHDRVTGPAPDLVLLDVHLPDASGIEFLKLMKANPQTAATPVIMISADAMPEQVDAALSAGAYCYLTKPVQLPALLVHVDDLLATHT